MALPKIYSDQERAYITKRLKEEAAACMGQFGIRLTTVDEIVRRVHIPKGNHIDMVNSANRLYYRSMRFRISLLRTRTNAKHTAGLFHRLTQQRQPHPNRTRRARGIKGVCHMLQRRLAHAAAVVCNRAEQAIFLLLQPDGKECGAGFGSIFRNVQNVQ